MRSPSAADEPPQGGETAAAEGGNAERPAEAAQARRQGRTAGAEGLESLAESKAAKDLF